MSNFNFQRFTAVGKRFEDRITITRNRAVGFPTQFYKQNYIDSYKFGVLYYDSNLNAIGVMFTNSEDEQGRIAITKSSNYGGHILANSFFKANRINTKKYAGRYDYEKKPLSEAGLEGEGDLYIIYLKEKQSEEVSAI